MKETIFNVTNLRGRMKTTDRNVIKSYEGNINIEKKKAATPNLESDDVDSEDGNQHDK